MFIDKNKYKLGREIVARVQAAMKMLNNLPVMEKDPVNSVGHIDSVDLHRSCIVQLCSG